jgi:hypothetical protein
MKKLYFIYLFLLNLSSFSQSTFTIKGKVIDLITRDPIPFVSVNFKGTTIGQNTDFEGNFLFSLATIPSDSLQFGCLGYINKAYYILKDLLKSNYKK